MNFDTIIDFKLLHESMSIISTLDADNVYKVYNLSKTAEVVCSTNFVT